MINSPENRPNNHEAESAPKLLEPFFDFEGKIAFIRRNGLRRECSQQEYLRSKEQAEKSLSEYPELISVKIRQGLGDELSKDDQINLKAAETFPNNRRLGILMLRSLSPDIPGTQLSEKEQAELDAALRDIQK